MSNKPEDICVSFETAQALHDAGIVVESVFWWYKISDQVYQNEYCIRYELWQNNTQEMWTESFKFEKACPSPQADELFPLLPHSVLINGTIWKFGILRLKTGVQVYYYGEGVFLGGKPKVHDKLCEAFADNVLRLKEAGYELNKTKEGKGEKEIRPGTSAFAVNDPSPFCLSSAKWNLIKNDDVVKGG